MHAWRWACDWLTRQLESARIAAPSNSHVALNVESLEPRVLLSGAPSIGLNLIDNGDFELGTVGIDPGVAGWETPLAGSAARVLNGTDFSGNSTTVAYLPPSDSNAALIYQDIQTGAGSNYLLTFDLRTTSGQVGSEDEIQVHWDGDYLVTLRATGVWQQAAVEFVGPRTGSARLLLARPISIEGPGVVIDNVCVVATIDESVDNGSFEIVSGTGPLYPDTGVPGWSNFEEPDLPAIRIVDRRFATDGAKILELNSSDNRVDHLWQDFNVVAGEEYLLTFDLKGRHGFDSRANELRVRWGGDWIGTFFGTERWNRHNIILRADNTGLQRLILREPGRPTAFTADGASALIDNIKLYRSTSDGGGDDGGTGDELTLTVDTSSNTTVQSSGTLVTNEPAFRVSGTTAPGATIAIARDGDGVFDDASVVADQSGNYATTVQLVHTDTNLGANHLIVRATNGTGDQLTESVDVHLAEGTVVRFDTSLGRWDVELLDDDAPNTVGAFLNDLSRYDDSIVHRSVSQFIVQGGGFSINGSSVEDVDDFPPPPNEFDRASPLNSNLRGTLSTAQTSNINSFSGQWFVNTIDNDSSSPFNNLDNVPHTVFGRVIGTGMTVIDAINNTPVFNLSGLLSGSGAGALTNVPLVDYINGVPSDDNYIRISSVAEILTPLGQENEFHVPENSPAGTIVGQVTPSTAVGGPLIFEFDDPALAEELKLNADDHLEGNPAATVVLIEYLSLQCPHCAVAHPDIEQLLADNPDDVLVVRRHFPLDVGSGGPFLHAFQAALAAEAAGRQGMFDEMVDELFARQPDWNNSVTSQQAQAVFEDIAVNTLGLNLTLFNQDMGAAELTNRINRDISDAGTLGLTGTPTFFLNGDVTTGTPTTTDVQAAAQLVDQVFLLNRLTGVITVGVSSSLDFETTPTFTRDVTVTNGTSETIQVSIELIDAFAG